MNEEKERADFEAALIAGCWVKAAPKRDAAGTYITDIFDAAWWAWQARAALAAQGAPADLAERLSLAHDACEDGDRAGCLAYLRTLLAEATQPAPAPTWARCVECSRPLTAPETWLLKGTCIKCERARKEELINGLTEAETRASASVYWLAPAQAQQAAVDRSMCPHQHSVDDWRLHRSEGAT